MRHSQPRTRPPRVRPIQYQMVSLPSDASAARRRTSARLNRPVPASAPAASKTGAAGIGNPLCSAKTQPETTTEPHPTRKSIPPSIPGGTIAPPTRRRAPRAPQEERLYHLAMSTLETRREQMFPKVSPEEIDRLRRFGTVRRYRAGEAPYRTGEISPAR